MKLRRSSSNAEGRQPRRRARKSLRGAAYHSQRVDAEVNTGRKQEREPSRPKPRFAWLQRFGYIVLSVVILVCAINILTLSSQAKIVVQNEESVASLRDPAVYETAATNLFASSALNRNKITVDTGMVRQEMERQFPELARIDVTIPWLAHRPVVYVKAVQPVLVVTTADGAYLIDARGVALTKAATPAELDQPELPIVSDQSGLKVAVGDQVLPARQVRFIEVVIAQLAAKQYTVSGLTLPAFTSELDVQLTGEPYQIKFNLQSADTARQQAGTFLATIAKLKKDNITPAKYIDVRLAGRAYYQ